MSRDFALSIKINLFNFSFKFYLSCIYNFYLLRLEDPLIKAMYALGYVLALKNFV